MNLSRFFTLAEMIHSNTAKAEGIDNQPAPEGVEFLRRLCTEVLDPLREAVGMSIKVNSGYRGPALNKRLKGATKSQHLEGQAADIEAPGLAVLALFKKAIELRLPFDQIIYEVKGASKWVHLSHNPAGNRGEILLAKFDAAGKVSYSAITAQQALEMTELVARGTSAESNGEYVEVADEPPQAAAVSRGVTQRGVKKAAPVAKKAAAKKAPAKTAPAKKAASKKAPAKKAAAKKAVGKKVATKKVATKKMAAKKAPPMNSATKKSAAKKAVVTKAPAKKLPARKVAAKKVAAKKAPAKKAPARKAPARSSR